MAILDALFGGGVGQLVKDVVGTFKLSPEEKAKIDAELEAHRFELAKIDAELEGKLADAASANIQAEAKSGDKYTSRARPTFLYVVNVIIAWNYIIVPIFKQAPVPLPEPLFWLFGSVMLGYVGARSWEKISGMKVG